MADTTNRKPELDPFPRIVAHRGLKRCPENTLPSFAAALALGANEIEFDVRGSKDGKLVVCHDGSVDRTTDGTGNICELTWKDLCKLNAGSYMGWENVPLCLAEDIFMRFSAMTVFNIHLKEPGRNGWIVKEIGKLACDYQIKDAIYIAGGKDVLEQCARQAPEIARCCLEGSKDGTIVDWAVRFDCKRLQFNSSRYDREMVQAAHEKNLICNLFYADTLEDVTRALQNGIDAVLTNYCDRILPAVVRETELGRG